MSEAGIVASDSGSGTAPAVEKKEDIKIWFPEQEHILKKWAEVSKSYRWFHDKAHSKYKWQNFWFSIPVIVLSNLTGIANFAQNSIPDDNENKRYVPLGIGFINILAGIITTVYQFLKVAELVEAHRSSSLLYSKFSRDISVQLTLPHQQRKYNGKDYLNMKKDEFDRLLEQAPVIPNKIVQQYTNEFMISDNCENGYRKIVKQSCCSYIFCCGCSPCCRKSSKPGTNSSKKQCTFRLDCDCNKCRSFTRPEILRIEPVDIYKPSQDEKFQVIVENVVNNMIKKNDIEPTDPQLKDIDLLLQNLRPLMGDNENEHNIDSDDNRPQSPHPQNSLYRRRAPKVEISKDTNGQVSGFNVDIQSPKPVSESSVLRDQESPVTSDDLLDQNSEAKPEGKPELVAEPKPQEKAEDKAEEKPQEKAEPKPEKKPEAKPQPAADVDDY